MKNLGQTLVEIIVVIGVVVILSTGLVILTTFSLKSTRLGGLRSQAVKYAAEGMEFVRQKRDSNWADFQALGKEHDGNGSDWCLLNGNVWVETVPCINNVNNFFGRDAEFTWDETNQRMAVTVTVDWTEGTNYYETDLTSYFSQPQL